MRTDQSKSRAMGACIWSSPCSKWMAAGLFLVTVLFLPAVGRAQCLLAGPQKIVIDTAHNRLLVSNNDTGDITQIDGSGTLSCFAARAGFIDGMEIAGNLVYGATNPKQIKSYDLDTGLPADSVMFPGTGDLSSIVADNTGHLYISCPTTNTIYKMRISDRAFWVFVGGTALNKPNGMFLQEAKNRLIVVEDRWHPRILAISLMDSTVTTLTTTALSGGDGIAMDTYGRYYVTGYYLSGVYRFDPLLSHAPTIIFSGGGIVYPTYDKVDNSMLVTLYDANSWARIPIDITGVRPTTPFKSLLLHHNAPNPFGPTTTIRFELASFAHTRLDVYDVTGDQVRTLVNEARGPGSYAVTWDGRNDSGERAACGTYFFSLKANGVEQAQKAMLTK